MSQAARVGVSDERRKSGSGWLLKRVCCYCHEVMGYTPCIEKMDGEVSHGICGECEKTLRVRLGLEGR